MVLLKCKRADRLTDEGLPCTLLCADVVRREETASGGLDPVGYVTVDRWELPEDYAPSGPLDLTQHPGGGSPSLTIFHYSIVEMFHGPVFFFLRVYDPTFDASPFIGGVFAAEGRGGEGGLEPLFRHSEREREERKRSVCPVPEHARRISLGELGLSAALKTCLESEGITTASDLCVRTAEELLEIRNLGKERLQEVRDRLAVAGLWLSDEKLCGGWEWSRV